MPSISINNFDSSFFSVKVEGILNGSPAAKFLTDKVINFEITEEMGKMMHGTLQMEENLFFMTSNSMARFTPIEIQWGYKNKNQIQKDAYVKSVNPKELFTSGQLIRFAKGVIQNPSWNFGSDGKMIYNCSFICFDNSWLNVGNNIYENDTKMGVVVKTLQEMGVKIFNVKFSMGDDIVTGDTSIRRDSCSLFNFLHKMAMEWQCLFRIAYDNKLKQPVALFCNYNDEKTIEEFVKTVGSCTGSSILWDYKDGKRNVMSYTAQYNSAEGGTGDSVRVMLINGQMTFQRTNAKTQAVTYHVLLPGKMRDEMQSAGNVAAQTQLLEKWMGAKKFEDIAKYFSDVTSKTAPQGIGLTVNIEAIGDPLCTAPARAKFGKGFPAIFSGIGIGTTFYQTSVTHKIDKSGYKMSVMCADAFSVSGGVGVG